MTRNNGNQKEAAKKRAAAQLAKNPNYYSDLARRRKGKPSTSSTKFKAGDPRTKKLARKGLEARYKAEDSTDGMEYEETPEKR